MNTLEASQEEFLSLINAERSRQTIHNICNRYTNSHEDRKDAEQEVITEAWASFSRFRGESSFNSWLYTIAYWTCCDMIRKAKTRAKALATHNFLYDVVDHSAVVRNHAYREKVLSAALEQLNEFDYELIYFYINEVPVELVTAYLNTSLETYRVKFKRAKDRLLQKAYDIIRKTDDEFWNSEPPLDSPAL